MALALQFQWFLKSLFIHIIDIAISYYVRDVAVIVTNIVIYIVIENCIDTFVDIVIDIVIVGSIVFAIYIIITVFCVF